MERKTLIIIITVIVLSMAYFYYNKYGKETFSNNGLVKLPRPVIDMNLAATKLRTELYNRRRSPVDEPLKGNYRMDHLYNNNHRLTGKDRSSGLPGKSVRYRGPVKDSFIKKTPLGLHYIQRDLPQGTSIRNTLVRVV